MRDEDKTKDRLIEELTQLRLLVAKLEASELHSRRTEEALKASEEKFRSLMEQAADAFFIHDFNGRFVDVNRRACEFLGYTREELLSLSVTDVEKNSDPERFRRIWESLAPSTPLSFDGLAVRKDGTSFPVDVRLSLFEYAGNRLSLAVVRDVSVQKKAAEALRAARDELERRVEERTAELLAVNEQLRNWIEERTRVAESLRESERRYRELADLLPQTVFEMDLDEKLTFVNRNAFDLFGYSEEDFKAGLNALEMLIAEDRESARENMRSALAGEIICGLDYTALRKDGQTFPVIVQAVAIMRGDKAVGLRGIVIDITERKQAEEALRKSEARYRAIVEDQTELVSRSTPEGTLTFVNDAYCRYYSEECKDIIGKTFWHHVIEEDRERLSKHLASLSRENPVQTIEHRYRTPAGDIRWQQWTDRAIIDDRGRICEIQSVGRDVTERKKAEEELMHLNEKLAEEHRQRKLLSKRLIELSENHRKNLAMELHDDIGQKATTLKLDLEWLSQRMHQMDEPLSEVIESAREKSVQIIRSIGDMAYGLRPSTLDNLGLVASIKGLIDNVQQRSGITIRLFSRKVPQRFDPEKGIAIYRVVQEALCNIIKHANAKKVFVNLVRRGDVLSLSVEDDGIGFETDQIMKGFDWDGKSSLGLLFMKERVMQVGGEFSIESRIGKGTHLLVEIPLKALC